MVRSLFEWRRRSRRPRPRRQDSTGSGTGGRRIAPNQHSAIEQLESRAMLAAVTLPAGTSYTETFDTIGTALPVGWAVYTGVTSSTRGTAATLTTAATAWNATTSGFKNYASADGGTSADTSAVQGGRADRALAVRQTSSGGLDPGAAFELELANTAGRTGFGMTVKHQMLDVQPRSTTWTVQYSTTGTSWTNLGTYADPGTWGSTAATYSFGSGIDNVGGPVYVRIAALAGATGSGNRDTYGIDDVSLTWTNASSTTPTITGAATAAAFTTTYGTPSAVQSFAVSGTSLTADIVATAPTGFEVSSDGTTYGPTATFVQTGGSAGGTLRVRLAATAPVAGAYDSRSVVLSSPGATSAAIVTAVSGNAVATKTLTISGLVAQNKDFDGTTTATVTGTPAYAGLVNGESFAVTGTVTWAFPDAVVGFGKTLVQTGTFAAPSTNYTVTQPTLTASILGSDPPPQPTVLLAEDFATLTAGGNTATTGAGSPSSTEVTTNLTANFPTSVKAYSAGGAVKLGTGSLPGSITSRSLDLSGNGGVFTVSFDVKGWTTVEGDIVVTVSGQAPRTVSYVATVASAFESKTLQFTGGQAASTITFATSAKRAFLDTIVVTGGSGSTTVVAPSAPTITGITPASGQLSVAFSPPVSNGGATITAYQYSLDGGVTWASPTPAVTTSPLVITGLVNGQSYAVRLRAVNSAGPGAASATVTGKPGAIDYLRIVSYNVTAADISGVRTGFETLVQAMAAESYAGHVDRVDLIAMQEVQSQATTSANLVTRLNAIYGAGTYARGTLDGDTTGSGTQGVVYNTAALQLLEETAIGTATSTGAPRQTLRYKFQPVGGDATSVFYVYNSHLKAADDSESAARRAADVQVIRADADALGAGTSIIYAGDFNLQTSNELAYERFLAAGNGQAFDPINRPGNWSNNSAFRDIFTQSPSANPPTGFAGGGLDDRYDFQLVSGPVMTGGGIAYKTGSYRTFGVDGSVAVGGSVNAASSTALPGLANRTQVLDLLVSVADHLPVVVDYAYLAVGEPVSPTITVSPGTLTAPLTTTVGTASAAETFAVSGAALTGSLTVTAPTGLEVSLAAASGYASTLTLTPAAGVLAATTVYVRLAATAAAGNYNAAAITVSGGGATTQTVLTTAGGNVVNTPSSTTLFAEDFAALTSGDNTSTGGSSTAWSGSANWSSVTGAYQAGGAVRLGTSSVPGSITTQPLDLSGNGGVFTVSFDVKGWTTVEGSIVVTVSGLAPQTVTYSATIGSAFQTITLQFTGGQANSTITFATSAKRAFLDNIVVTGGVPEPVVTGIAGFVWDDADGDGTWDMPTEAGIAGRTVYLDIDRDGALGAAEPNVVTGVDGGYSFTGLGAGTYIVAQVVPPGWEQTFPSITVAAAQVRSSSGVQVATFTDPAYAPDGRQQEKRLVPNDPLFARQWHLRNTGQLSGTAGQDANVGAAWDVATGAGVVIGIVDDGLQHTHPDLAPGYRADLSYDFNGGDADPMPETGDDHGTAAAGVAAARGNNGVGVSGSAPSASLAGLRLISVATTDQQEATGLTFKPQDIGIYSNSWGPSDDGFTLEAPGPLTRAAFATAVQTGRGGRGSIYVWAAGNGLDANDNSNYDGYANSRYTIAVTAVDNRGRQSWYAEPGANILVAAPSSGDSSGTEVGIVTTDRTGSAGYNTGSTAGNLPDGNYTNDFGGTSSATPVVSGVVALMLEANPNLGWRDVQHILANSARKNDPTDVGWSQNGAGKWVNHKYGFGVVDAAAAVNLAKTWTNVGPEVSASSGTITVGRAIPDNNATGITSSFTLGADIRMESVEIVFSATHARRGNLQVVLIAPSGTKSVLAEKHADTGANYSGWVFSTVRDWGESSKGTWTLTVSDLTSGTTGTFGSWALNVYGTALPAPPGTQSVTVSAGQTVADVNFGVRSTAPATPTLGTTGVLAGVSTTYGTPSGATQITVTGTNLSAAVTATAPAGFVVSSDGTTFGATATFTPTGGAVNGTVYVRLPAATAVGTYSGDVTLSSAGAADVVAPMPSSTVTKKTLTVRADDASRLLDEADPAFTATITGFVNGETASVLSGAASLATPATATSPAGAYAITAAVGTLAAANYDFAFTAGTLTIDDTLVFDVASGQTVTPAAGRSGALKVVKRGLGTLLWNVASGHTGTTTVEAGTLIVATGDALASSVVTVLPGATLAVGAGVTMRAPNLTLAGGTLDGTGATLLVNATTGIGTFVITSGAVAGSPRLVVSGNGAVVLPNDRRQAVALTALTVDSASGGRLDIGKGRIDVATGGITAADLRAALVAGRTAGGTFAGTAGIVTSGGKASPSSANPAVGYRVLSSGAAVVAWAAYGDANLDGQVNITDVNLMNSGGKYGQGVSTNAVWAQGDFNYSGGVTLTDISLFNGAALFAAGSYLPVAPSSSTTQSTAISPDVWAAYALETQNQQTKKR